MIRSIGGCVPIGGGGDATAAASRSCDWRRPCPTAQQCEDGVCRPKLPCSSTSPCPPGLSCDRGYCSIPSCSTTYQQYNRGQTLRGDLWVTSATTPPTIIAGGTTTAPQSNYYSIQAFPGALHDALAAGEYATTPQQVSKFAAVCRASQP